MEGEFRVHVLGIKTILIDELGGQAYDIKQAILVSNQDVFVGVKPVDEGDMANLITTFNSTRNLYKQGGLSAKFAYSSAHTNLLDCILLLGPYVNEIAQGKEDVFKLSMIPYWNGIDESGELIKNGALPVNLSYTSGATGVAKVTCDAFGKGTRFICFAVKDGKFPEGTRMTLDGQIVFPIGETVPPYLVNVNGKRTKTLVDLIPKTDYYLYYVMIWGNYTSGLSLPLKIAGGN